MGGGRGTRGGELIPKYPVLKGPKIYRGAYDAAKNPYIPLDAGANLKIFPAPLAPRKKLNIHYCSLFISFLKTKFPKRTIVTYFCGAFGAAYSTPNTYRYGLHYTSKNPFYGM